MVDGGRTRIDESYPQVSAPSGRGGWRELDMPGTTSEGVSHGATVLSRRRLLLEGAGAAAGLAVLGTGLQGCGAASKSTSGSGSSTGTAVMENYPNWMG